MFMGGHRTFRVTLTAKGRDTYAARSGEHDDLVIAVALAVWGGVTMSALAPISSALPPGADSPGGFAEGPFLTLSGT